MTEQAMMELGRAAARTTGDPFRSMKRAYERSVAEHGPMDWMAWTLGYCREVCGALIATTAT